MKWETFHTDTFRKGEEKREAVRSETLQREWNLSGILKVQNRLEGKTWDCGGTQSDLQEDRDWDELRKFLGQ